MREGGSISKDMNPLKPESHDKIETRLQQIEKEINKLVEERKELEERCGKKTKVVVRRTDPSQKTSVLG